MGATLFDDEPIKSGGDDTLDRRSFANNISSLIRLRTRDRPLVMALHGPWGSGKTSVLNMVREELERAEEAHVQEFDPWYFNSEEALLQSFLGTALAGIEGAGKNKKLTKRLQQLVQKYSSHLSTAAQILGGASAKAVLELFKKGPQDLRREIAEAARDLEKPVVILIDNVDRLDKAECRLVLKLVRLCSDFPNFVYLLAFDRTVVARMLEPEGAEFLEKIVQVEIPLPPLSQSQVERVIANGVQELAGRAGIDAKEAVEWILPHGERTETIRRWVGKREGVLVGVIESLRDAKRFLNSITATLPLVAHEVNPRDFVILEMLRVFHPSIYDDVCRHRHRLAAFDRDSSRGEAERKERTAFLERLAKDMAPAAAGLIADVFPAFASAVHRSSRNSTADSAEGWARRMRASHPDYVDLYFQLRVPDGEVPRAEIAALGQELGELDEAAATDRFRRALEQHQVTDRFRRFLARCEFFTDSLPLTPSIGCTKAIGAFSASIPLDPDDSPTSNFHDMNAAASLVFVMLRKAQDTSTIGDVLLDLIRQTPSLEFARTLAVFATSPGRNEILSSFKNIDADQVRAVLGARIRSYFTAEGHDLLAEHPRTWVSIIEWWPEEADLNDYLRQLLISMPSNWEILIGPVCDHEPRGRRYLQLQRLPRSVRMLELLGAAPSNADGGHYLSAFIGTISMAKELHTELSEMKQGAASVAGLTTGTEPSVDWATPAMDRHRTTVEGWPGSSDILAAHKQWDELRQRISQLRADNGPNHDGNREEVQSTARSLAEGLSPILAGWEARLRTLPVVYLRGEDDADD